eukprot:COSAG03_NODE_2378_length_2825_cov_76.434336_2_plen_84_part_00
MPANRPAVVVVGGGVMGMASAVRLLEAGFDDVTVVAEKLAGITSKSSPAVFRPDWLGDTPQQRVIEWGLETRCVCHTIPTAAH